MSKLPLFIPNAQNKSQRGFSTVKNIPEGLALADILTDHQTQDYLADLEEISLSLRSANLYLTEWEEYRNLSLFALFKRTIWCKRPVFVDYDAEEIIEYVQIRTTLFLQQLLAKAPTKSVEEQKDFKVREAAFLNHLQDALTVQQQQFKLIARIRARFFAEPLLSDEDIAEKTEETEKNEKRD